MLRILKITTWAGIGFALAWIIYGLLRYPAVLTAPPNGWLGLAAALLVFTLYALAVQFAAPRIARAFPAALNAGAAAGFVMAGVFLASFLLEYFSNITGEQDGVLALFLFGLFFLLFFGLGIGVTFQTGRSRAGVLAALVCALLASLLWIDILWCTNFIFVSTPLAAHFYEINGATSSFQGSHMANIETFVVSDNLGATFFHTLLAAIIAPILGELGALIGYGAQRIFRRK